jgi:hypothetical protein
MGESESGESVSKLKSANQVRNQAQTEQNIGVPDMVEND